MKHPRILFYLFRYRGLGGIERVTQTLVRLLRERGFFVAVCAFSQPNPDDGTVADDTETSDAPNSDPRNPKNRHFLRDAVCGTNADLVVFQDSYAPLESQLADLPDSVRIVIVEHNTPTIPVGPFHMSGGFRLLRHLPSWLKSVKAERWTRRRHRALYDRADRYVLLSDRYFGEMRWVAGLNDARKLRAIPNVNTFDILPSVPEKRNEVLFLGSLLRVKGVDLLLDAWKRLAPAFEGWTLRIVGDGPLRSSLEDIVRSSGTPRVLFLGAQTNVAPFLQSAAILAAPSRYEGFPMVLPEAMSHGTVPVCFDSYSALRDIVSDGVDGRIVPPFDVSAFADALGGLMGDSVRRGRMAVRALASAARFSAERVLPLWENLFSELMTETERSQ